MSDQSVNANAIELSMKQMDEIQNEASALAHGAAKSFGDVFKYSLVSQKILNTLTPDVITQVFLPLRNKDFGWREDVPGKYQIQELRDVFTSATLYGAIPANNEILIISGRFYPQKNFFTRKLAEMSKLTDLILLPGKVTVAPNGALVEYSATWKYDGKAMEMRRTGTSAIPVRLNNGQGADAALGKAERKIKAAIYNQLTGSTFSEGEAEEIAVEGTPSSSGVVVKDSTEDGAPAASQTASVVAAVASKRVDKPAPSGPQPWEGAGAIEAVKVAPEINPQSGGKSPAPTQEKAVTAPSAASAPPQQQPAPAQGAPKQAASTPAATTTTQQPAATPRPTGTQPPAGGAVKLMPSPKFSGNGDGEIEEVTYKVVKVMGAKPPHRIIMEDKIDYWTKDTNKAKEAKSLQDKGVPVLMQYIVEPSGRSDVPDFRIAIEVQAADFGPGDDSIQGDEDNME